MSVTVVAILTPKPASVDTVRALLTDSVADVHAEAGCELYTLHEGGGRFVFVEQWASPEALDAHNAGPVIARVVSGLDGHLDAAPEIVVTTPIVTGDPAKGTLRRA
jgi:quinol monooxygenase YgiN